MKALAATRLTVVWQPFLSLTEETDDMAAASEKHSTTPRVIHATVGGVQLNDEQRAAIKTASGVDVEWLLFTQSKDHARSMVARSPLPG
jgi:hypothetical protein